MVFLEFQNIYGQLIAKNEYNINNHVVMEAAAYGEPKVSTQSSVGKGKPSPDQGIMDKIRQTFPEDSETAIKLFKLESGLNPSCPSQTDIMADGRPFSWGLVQINLTAHTIGSVECYKAFRGKNSEAVVIDEDLYSKCVEMAKNADISLALARKLYDSRGWSDWGANKFLNL